MSDSYRIYSSCGYSTHQDHFWIWCVRTVCNCRSYYWNSWIKEKRWRLVNATVPGHHLTIGWCIWYFLMQECWVFDSYFFENSSDIILRFYMYECWAVFFDTRESVEVLYKMFSCFHHSFSCLTIPEESPMFIHYIEYLTECWFIVSRKKTPRIPKWCSSNHKSIEILFSFWMNHLL